MNSRQQVLCVLAGEKPGRMPFIIWNNKLPTPAIEQRLLDLGACVIVKSTVWRSHLDGIEVRCDPLPTTRDGHARTCTVYRTPAGEVSEVHTRMPGTAWCEKHLFESPADYDAIEALLQARRYTPAFDVFRADDKRYPGACLARRGAFQEFGDRQRLRYCSVPARGRERPGRARVLPGDAHPRLEQRRPPHGHGRRAGTDPCGWRYCKHCL